MSSIVLSIDSRELSRFINRLNRYSTEKQEAVKKEVTRATYAIQAKAKQNTSTFKHPTGFLRNKIDAVIKNNSVTGQVIVKAKYGLWVHDKTKPHKIPVGAKGFLAWRPIVGYSISGRRALYRTAAGGVTVSRSRGTYVFTQKPVNHPGTKGQPFLSTAADSERPIYQQNLINIFNK